MRDYLSLVKNDACSWVAALNLWTEYAWTPELVEIANVNNIISLEINSPLRYDVLDEHQSQGVVTLNDRILRTWSELTQTSGAFKHLRVLKLYGQTNLTGITFRYLSAFPSLEMCVIALCDGLTSRSAAKLAGAYGWLLRHDRELEEIHELSKPGSQRRYEPGIEWEDCKNSKRLIPPTLPKDTPLLEFTVGQRWERPRNNFELVVYYRDGIDKKAEIKKRKDCIFAVGDGEMVPKRAKKPTLKNTGQKDLSGLLAEFS
jgi:hypothetical protein